MCLIKYCDSWYHQMTILLLTKIGNLEGRADLGSTGDEGNKIKDLGHIENEVFTG